jgi:hypothetical protein
VSTPCGGHHGRPSGRSFPASQPEPATIRPAAGLESLSPGTADLDSPIKGGRHSQGAGTAVSRYSQ